MFKRGGSIPRSNPLPFKSFIYHFWQKGYPFRTPSIDKWYPFHPLPNLELYIIITTINTLSCKYNWTSLQRPPWGKKKTGPCREVETKGNVWTARQKKNGRCREVAVGGGSTVWIICNFFQSHKMYLLALLGLFTDPNDRFSYPSLHTL